MDTNCPRQDKKTDKYYTIPVLCLVLSVDWSKTKYFVQGRDTSDCSAIRKHPLGA